MSLNEKNRHDLYAGLCTVIDNEEAVQEMLSNFPARDLDEPVTRDHLRAGLSEVRTEIAEVRTEIAEVRIEIAEVRTEMHTEIAGVRTEMHTGFTAVREEVRTTMRNWTLGGLTLAVTASGVVTAIIQAVAS